MLLLLPSVNYLFEVATPSSRFQAQQGLTAEGGLAGVGVQASEGGAAMLPGLGCCFLTGDSRLTRVDRTKDCLLVYLYVFVCMHASVSDCLSVYVSVNIFMCISASFSCAFP